jgi:flagellar biogenesis protein FliO
MGGDRFDSRRIDRRDHDVGFGRRQIRREDQRAESTSELIAPVSGGFWVRYALDMVVVALILGGLYAVARGLSRGRVLLSAQRRLVTVLESTMLSQHSSVHVVKVGGRYFLIGAANGHVASLGELPSDEIESWMTEQRAFHADRTRSLSDAFKFLRGRS